jgi:hypothetical protein
MLESVVGIAGQDMVTRHTFVFVCFKAQTQAILERGKLLSDDVKPLLELCCELEQTHENIHDIRTGQ